MANQGKSTMMLTLMRAAMSSGRRVSTRFHWISTNATSQPASGALLPILARENPFRQPLQAWERDFQTFSPLRIIGLASPIFGARIRKDVIHRVVVWYLASLRAGTASTKQRGEVAGSNRKIRPQKGTGMARAGSNRTPNRRGGGICFGPKPRTFYYPLSPKIRQLALRSALSAKFKQDQLAIIEDVSLKLESFKTKEMVAILSNIPAKKVLLLDTQPLGKNIELAARSLSRNFSFMDITRKAFNAYHALNNSYLLLTNRAKRHLETALNEEIRPKSQHHRTLCQ